MIINGDALTVLKRMDSESVHMAVTSSPYFGLRSYGTEPQIWDGDPNCQHEWGTVHPPGYRSSDTKPGPLQNEGNTNRQNLKSDVCVRCNAWRGELGSEPSPELFVRHITTICHELKRVLRNDGTFFYNIGDSYWGGKGQSGGGDPQEQALRNKEGVSINGAHHQTGGNGKTRPTDGKHPSIKAKDLIGIPWMIAFALRADGWYLRADLPWLKRNALPSSVTDRPSSSIEHVFLFSKSGDTKFWTHPTKCGTRTYPEPDYIYTNKATGEITQTPPQDWKEIMYVKEGETKESNLWKRRNLWDGHDYFYDHVATMQPSSESYNKDKRPRGKLRQTVNANSKYPDERQFKKQDGTGNPTVTGFNARYEDNGNGLRFMRDSDFFFKTWQGLLHNEDGEPMALVVNPRGYKGAHFACFPIRLAEVLILAGTSDHGVCPHCGSPWVRNTVKESYITRPSFGNNDQKQKLEPGVAQGLERTGGHVASSVQTTGWSPSCSCPNNVPSPSIVLDPFGGSSATGVACKLHNRNYIGIELNPEYCKLGEQRVRDGR